MLKRTLSFLKICLVLLLACLAVLSFADTDAEALQNQALKVIRCIKAKDWKSLFNNMAVTGDLKKISADDFAKAFAAGLQGSGHGSDFDLVVDAIQSYKVGAPVIEEERGYVPTSFVLKFKDQELNFVGVARMIKEDGIWKFDFSEAGDQEKLSELRFGQLLGGIAVPGS